MSLWKILCPLNNQKIIKTQSYHFSPNWQKTENNTPKFQRSEEKGTLLCY